MNHTIIHDCFGHVKQTNFFKNNFFEKTKKNSQTNCNLSFPKESIETGELQSMKRALQTETMIKASLNKLPFKLFFFCLFQFTTKGAQLGDYRCLLSLYSSLKMN